MIRAAKDYDNPPEVLLNPGCRKKIKRAVENKDGSQYNGNHYKNEDVLETLKGIYHHKCSYCESKTEHVAALQVEHYRPKDGLKVEQIGDEDHTGYYWLGCEWSNLLLGCPKCNGKGAKGTRFPISGTRVFHGNPFDHTGNIDSFDRSTLMANNSPLKDELPLLLNPEQDEPEEHLEFNRLGELTGKTERGKETIDICQLNRDPLFSERQKVVNELLENINIVIQAVEGEVFPIDNEGVKFLLKIAFDKIKQRQGPDREYALWGRFMFSEFEYCFVSRIKPAFQETIREAFDLYNQNRLYKG